MKLYFLSFTAMLFLITSCSNDSGKFSGVWQSINDPSKQLIFTHSGKSFSFETRNIESAVQGLPGTYNDEKHALEFDNGKGEITLLVYNSAAKHIVGLGEEFEKSTNAVLDKEGGEETTQDANGEETPEKTADAAPSENTSVSENAKNCDKGDVLVISGNNVRVRTEPDVTKQNILFQVHKGYEVVHLDNKSVDGQKWYKVCYDGNIGWVSGQYASKK
jgi:hypothetical protein